MRKLFGAKPSSNPVIRPTMASTVSRGASVPPPIEGWDAISPISAMSPKRAVKLDNWFPQPGWVELRKGHILHADTETGDPVETLAAYQGLTSNKLFAASGSEIFDVTLGSTLQVAGLTNARFQHINFATTGGNFLYMVNGADVPQYYNGSAWASAVITGTGIVPTDIVGVNAHKNRLWFTFNDSSDAAYLPVDSIQGAAVKFPLGGLFTMGGYLMATGTWSIDAGDGPDDYFVAVSSRGQVAIYRGTNPADAAEWELVGVFNMGAPIGRRCLTRVGADIGIICIDGVVPLSRAMIFERAAVQKVSLTQNIQRVMNESARNYGENFGWQLISYPRGTRAILNVPLRENNTQHQYVMNTLSGAWCRFIGMNANCWELLDNRLYFGGNDGVVYEADRSGTDVGSILTADMRCAFNYFGERGRQKRWMMCRPQLTTDGQIQPGLAFNVDFSEDAAITVPVSEAANLALWDVAEWDEGLWGGATFSQNNWTSVTGLGYCASIRMQVEIEHPGADVDGTEVQLQVNGFDVVMENGSIV